MSNRLSALHGAVVALLAPTALLLSNLSAQAQTPGSDDIAKFYKQNGLRLVVASGAGGGFDGYSRVLARHYNRHLPGNPSIVVQNMPGASGITATTWAYNTAPRDGSRILATYSTMIPQNLFENKNAQFDVRGFNWVGSIAKTQLLCVTWHTNANKDIKQLVGNEATVSATGRTGNSATMPLILNQLLGTQFKVISGYSTAGSYLALERGEVDGICGVGISTLRAAKPDWFDNKRVNVIVQVGLEKHPDLPDTPNALDLIADKNRDILAFSAIVQEMGRPYLAPPNVPADRLAALRTAFDATMKDKAFIGEAEKLALDVSPLTGAEMEKLIERLYSYSPDTVREVAHMLGMAEKQEVMQCEKFAGQQAERCGKGD